MNPLAFVPLSALVAAVVAGTLVFHQNPRNLLNRIVALYCVVAAYYGFVEFGLIQADTFGEAFVWTKAGAFWLFAPSLLLHLALVLTEKRNWLEKRWTRFLIYFPAFAFSLVDLATNAVLGVPEELARGWAYGVSEYPAIPFLAFVWAVGIGFLSLHLCWRYYQRTTDQETKQRVKYALVGLAVPLAALLMVEVLLPNFKTNAPEFASAALAAGSICLAYGAFRHGLFVRTPATAADNIISTMSDALLLVDPEGRIVMANRAALELLGCEKREVVGQRLRAVLDPGEGDETGVAVLQLLTMDSGEAVETTIRTGTGRVVELSMSVSQVSDARGSILGRVYVGRDITERKRMEEALILKENAIENSFSAIAMSDPEGRITYVNKACMGMWGSDDKRDVLGKPYWTLLRSDEAIKDIAAAMLEKGAWEGELVARKKDGREVHVEVWAGLVRDDKGNPVQTISSFRDVTEIKRAEEEKLKMEQQLQLAGRLAAVGELAAGVAHELNNPLAAVQAFAEFLAGREDLDEQVKSDVATIYKESQRATRITTNLLSFARKHNPEKRLININEAVQKSLELHSYRMKVNNIGVATELDPGLPLTMADFHQLQQVFVNIITNAEQAMTEAHGRGTLCVKTRLAGGMIVISFTDDGPGIAREHLRSIFDPFFTTKGVGKGTGLGLSICYGIVHQHNGRLYATSSAGRGANFVVEIPVLSEHDPAPNGAAPAEVARATFEQDLGRVERRGTS